MAQTRYASSSPEASPNRSQGEMSIPHRPSNQHKRRRDTQTGGPASRRRTASPEHDANFGYDPDQPIEERRKLQAGLRNLQHEVADRTDELVQPNSTGIGDFVKKANQLSISVKQPSEALYDSRLLVQFSELMTRKTQNLTKGGLAQGLDMDGFISKSISYMRRGRGLDDDDAPQLSSTQRQRRGNDGNAGAGDDQAADENEADDGDMLHWEHYGQFACVPYIGRPSLPGFLIGPLSVEKKIRRITQRAARFRPNDIQEIKPQLIQKEDLGQENNDLTAACSTILERLVEYGSSCQEDLQVMSDANASRSDLDATMDKMGLHETGTIDLCRFAINPRSFGQTVENLFYISFLIRDRKVEVDFNEEGFATIFPYDKKTGRRSGDDAGSGDDDDDGEQEEQEEDGEKERRQAVFCIDMDVWREAIDAFNITEPLIPHREEKHQAPGARGWY